MTEQMLFQCGCGKTYTSYPAFSNHKKQKHDNQTPPNSILPKHYQPKRGRPAFTIPTHQPSPSAPLFSGLTVVELGLLKMEEAYPNIISEPEVETNLN